MWTYYKQFLSLSLRELTNSWNSYSFLGYAVNGETNFSLTTGWRVTVESLYRWPMVVEGSNASGQVQRRPWKYLLVVFPWPPHVLCLLVYLCTTGTDQYVIRPCITWVFALITFRLGIELPCSQPVWTCMLKPDLQLSDGFKTGWPTMKPSGQFWSWLLILWTKYLVRILYSGRSHI